MAVKITNEHRRQIDGLAEEALSGFLEDFEIKDRAQALELLSQLRQAMVNTLCDSIVDENSFEYDED